MIQYKTVFESTQNLPKNIVLGHGENADLVAGFTDCGVEVTLSDYTPRAIYQPKSKWGTDEWFECPCNISGDTVVAHWGNLYDNGDNAVKMFLHLSKDGTVAYPGIYHIRLFDTPGFAPNPLIPIPETIDFAEYTLVNAPWALLSDFNTLSNSVSAISSDIGNPDFIIRRNQWNQVGVNDEIVALKLTAQENMGIPYITFVNEENDGDVYDIRVPDEPAGEGGEHHELSLPNLTGTLVVDSQLSTIVAGIPYSYRTIIASADVVVDVENREVVGIVCDEGTSANIWINPPAPVEGQVIDFVVDITNKTSADVRTLINFGTTWNAVLEEGDLLASYSYIEAGKMERLVFKQLGFPTSSGRPQLYLSRKYLTVH